MSLGEQLGPQTAAEGEDPRIEELIKLGLLPPPKKRAMLPLATRTGAVTTAVAPGQEGPSDPAASARAQSSLDAPLPQAAPPRPPMLPQARAQAAPPVAPQGAPAQAGGALPQAMGRSPDYLRPGYPMEMQGKADALMRQSYDKLMPSEDELGTARQGAMQGQLASMAMGLMGPGMSEAAQPMLKQALAEQEKFTNDPYKRADVAAKRLQAEAAIWEHRATQATTLQEKRYAEDQAAEVKRELAKERLAMMGMVSGIAAGSRADAAQARLDQNMTTRASALRNDFDPLVKDLRVSIQTYPQIQAALTSKTPTPASDMRAIFRYMKMLDPTSVVRESEYATAKNAAGVPDKVRNAYNKVMTGVILTPTQRQDFLAQAKSEADTAQASFDTQARRFHEIARRQRLDPRDITPGFDFNAGQPAAPEGIDVGDALKSGRVQGRRREDYRQSNL